MSWLSATCWMLKIVVQLEQEEPKDYLMHCKLEGYSWSIVLLLVARDISQVANFDPDPGPLEMYWMLYFDQKLELVMIYLL